MILALAITACEEDNPLHCKTDSECAQKITAGVYGDSDDGDGFTAGSDKLYCHPTKSYCYAGCKTDADCQNTALRMNTAEPDKTTCNLTTHHCEAPTTQDGGVVDQPTGLPLGAECVTADQCTEGRCVDHICCDSDCDSPCSSCALDDKKGTCSPAPAGTDPRGDCAGTDPACAGSCDGSGACLFTTEGTPCGAPRCQDGFLTEHACGDEGSCTAGTPTGCMGFACDATDQACKTTCDDKSDCMDDFECVGLACLADLILGAECFGLDAACNSQHCVDDVCCDAAGCDPCNKCDGPGGADKGTCAPFPAGSAPQDHCPGDPACGADQCDGQGACAYQPEGTLCSSLCAGGSQTNTTCGAAHTCTAVTTTTCGAYTCDGAGEKCHTSCLTHADCVTDSVCDRSGAHDTGVGECIAPTNVTTVTQGQSLQNAIDNMGSKTHIKLMAGAQSYSEGIDFGSKTITLIGSDDPIVSTNAASGPAITMGAGATVTLQGLIIRDGKNSIAGNGIYCVGNLSTSTQLTILESTIKSNEALGIKANDCNVTLHRNTIQQNSGGGINLSGGTFHISNNVIADNGSSSSSLGGAQISGTVTFVNNTLVSNDASSISAGGIICSGSYTLKNTILQNNSGSSQFLGCAFEYSNVYSAASTTAPPGTGNISEDCTLDTDFKPAATSGCVNQGDSGAAGLGQLDRHNQSRISGVVDMGAFEVL